MLWHLQQQPTIHLFILDFNRREHEEKIFIAIFFIMICLPSLGMFFYKTDISAEKREVQTFPKVKENGKVNMDFFNQLSDYFRIISHFVNSL